MSGVETFIENDDDNNDENESNNANNADDQQQPNSDNQENGNFSSEMSNNEEDTRECVNASDSKEIENDENDQEDHDGDNNHDNDLDNNNEAALEIDWTNASIANKTFKQFDNWKSKTICTEQSFNDWCATTTANNINRKIPLITKDNIREVFTVREQLVLHRYRCITLKHERQTPIEHAKAHAVEFNEETGTLARVI